MQGFTIAQLHTFRRQLQTFRRINVALKALKHAKAFVAGLEDDQWDTRTPSRGKGGKTKAKSGGGGRQRAALVRRPQQTEDSDDEDEEEEEEEGSSSAEDTEASGSLYLSDSDDDRQRPAKRPAGAGGARRRSLREQSTRKKSLREPSESEDSESDASEGELEIKISPQKKQKFVVVKDGAPDAPIQLIKLQPVRVPWPQGEAAVCSVCGDGDGTDDNAILLCEGRDCEVAVHQHCYGVAQVPKGKWLCDGCKAKLDPTAANCALCPVVGGAVRKVAKLGSVQPCALGPVYIHLACSLYTPELGLEDPTSMDKVNVSALGKARIDLICGLCGQGGGAVM